jgi:hypothetical protein
MKRILQRFQSILGIISNIQASVASLIVHLQRGRDLDRAIRGQMKGKFILDPGGQGCVMRKKRFIG